MVQPTGFNFSAAITASATQLSNAAKTPSYGFTIKADPANTQTVYFGYTNTVTAKTAAATDGMPLAAGEAYYIPLAAANDVNQVWLISASGTQTVEVEGC